ncbi:hypothetical protein [Kangiella marina]|uniref:Uncharacterized protein n=1 Tax=Kangiella marina TaxID=1079178 RepID=A0ABP8IQ50_9GAMM
MVTYVKRVAVILLGLSLWKVSHAESQDIMVLPVSIDDAGSYHIAAEPLHITYREGYDNQPKFSHDGQSLFFTRMQPRVDKASEAQTDIYRYQFGSGKLSNLTETEEHSEYSATPYDKSHISIIGVNPAGQQHLRLVNLDTKKHQSLRTDIEPVGYHAWMTDTQAAVFVLGDVMTLQVLDTESDAKPDVLASNIGRCFERLPSGDVTLTLERDGVHQLYQLNQEHQLQSLDISLPKGVQDYVWLDDETVIVGNNSALELVSSKGRELLIDLASLQVNGISRLALSPDKTKLALVYNRP